MTLWEFLLGLLALIAVPYVVARMISIAHYRSRAEYERRDFDANQRRKN